MVTRPPYLVHGDTIALVCPSGYMDPGKAQVCIETLQEWGYKVKMGKSFEADSGNYFSASDQDRADDLQEQMDDPSVNAILCARGGYGLSRIIDRLHFKTFRSNPKWIIGFSDVTVLHTHLNSRYRIASMHAPMASAFNEGRDKGPFVLSLKKALEGHKLRYECGAHPLNRKGETIAELTGGNLSLLVHLLGTESEPKTRGKILFLEDVGEYLYHIDRMMLQLKRAGKLDHLAGLIIGGFTEMKDTDRPFGKNIYELIYAHVKEYEYPVCFGFPVSHGPDNYALKSGLGHKLKVGRQKTSLSE
jgi:muramoyltetrapeptide carboxypeptidase